MPEDLENPENRKHATRLLSVNNISPGAVGEGPSTFFREQSLVVEGLEALFQQIPFPVKGIDLDNDGAFINETLLSFSEIRGIEFTRSRAYHKNDQAWIEQKNGMVVRKFVGHERFSGIVAGQTLDHLYQSVRLYVSYFQPSFKLLSKSRNGAKVTRKYETPATPCDRLLRCFASSISPWFS